MQLPTPRIRHARRAAALPALAAALTLTLAGCGTGTVDQSDVEKKAEQALGEQVGITPNIDCPDDLKAEKGATLRCELSVDGDDKVYGVTVTATKVDGDNVSMDFKVDDEPKQ